MQKYKLGNKLGDGSFGTVVKALNQQTGQLVAIKRMKAEYRDWKECASLNEVRILSKLHHPNIVNLLQLIKQHNQLYFVFEYMHRNVYQLLQERGKLPHHQVRNIAFQTLQALAYTHRKGFFHRDMKPQNMLEHHSTIKLADFGLARQIRAKPPFTQYVSTRWYRAPEALIRGRNYNSPMDLFALGAIISELYTGSPLFPGSTERDQLVRVLQLMGTPSKDQWPEGHRLAAQLSFELPVFQATALSKAIPEAPPQALDLIRGLLQIAPQKRLTAQQALQHQYFKVKASEKSSETLAEMREVDRQEEGWGTRARYRPGKRCQL